MRTMIDMTMMRKRPDIGKREVIYRVNKGPNAETLERILDCGIREMIELEACKVVHRECRGDIWNSGMLEYVDFGVKLTNLRLENPEISVASKLRRGECIVLWGEIADLQLDEQDKSDLNEIGTVYLCPGATIKVVYWGGPCSGSGRLALVLKQPLLIELRNNYWLRVTTDDSDEFDIAMHEEICKMKDVIDELTQLRFRKLSQRLYDLPTTKIDVDAVVEFFAGWHDSISPKTRHQLCDELLSRLNDEVRDPTNDEKVEVALDEALMEIVGPYCSDDRDESYINYDEEVILCLYGQIVDYVVSLT